MAEKITQSQLDNLLSAEPFITDRGEHPDSAPFLDLFFSAERDHFTQSFSELEFAPGEIVFRENEPGDTMYIVLTGRFAILKGELDSPTIIGYRGAGEIVGEMALLDNQPRSATIVAIDALHLLGINRQGFRHLLEVMPSVSFRIMEVLSTRLRKSDEVRIRGDRSERDLISQVALLQNEKQRLEELQRLRQETSELIIHDLRNPLGAIAISLKMLSVMLPEEVLEPHRQFLDVAQTSTERMRRLVDTLLEVARMEAGETEFTLGELDLCPMLKDIIERVSIVDRKGIDLKLEIPEDLPHANADREKIERVITNLVDNALKYTPENGRIVVSACSKDGYICTSVTDNGPGIPPDQRERIFERFTQVEGERRARRGFGLGLAYCHLAVERHKGKIWVEDGEGGVGSRFIFTLPNFRL